MAEGNEPLHITYGASDVHPTMIRCKDSAIREPPDEVPPQGGLSGLNMTRRDEPNLQLDREEMLVCKTSFEQNNLRDDRDWHLYGRKPTPVHKNDPNAWIFDEETEPDDSVFCLPPPPRIPRWDLYTHLHGPSAQEIYEQSIVPGKQDPAKHLLQRSLRPGAVFSFEEHKAVLELLTDDFWEARMKAAPKYAELQKKIQAYDGAPEAPPDTPSGQVAVDDNPLAREAGPNGEVMFSRRRGGEATGQVRKAAQEVAARGGEAVAGRSTPVVDPFAHFTAYEQGTQLSPYASVVTGLLESMRRERGKHPKGKSAQKKG